MIELAKKYKCQNDKCKYYLNDADDLKLFPDYKFDFIYSNHFDTLNPDILKIT